jgi:hypothetical protein
MGFHPQSPPPTSPASPTPDSPAPILGRPATPPLALRTPGTPLSRPARAGHTHTGYTGPPPPPHSASSPRPTSIHLRYRSSPRLLPLPHPPAQRLHAQYRHTPQQFVSIPPFRSLTHPLPHTPPKPPNRIRTTRCAGDTEPVSPNRVHSDRLRRLWNVSVPPPLHPHPPFAGKLTPNAPLSVPASIRSYPRASAVPNPSPSFAR